MPIANGGVSRARRMMASNTHLPGNKWRASHQASGVPRATISASEIKL
jgi:hypothetical protein